MPNSNKPAGGLKGYAQNIVKEANDFGRKYKQADRARGEIGPGTDAKANRLRNQQDRALGQLFGAVLGKKYDAKGRRVG